jgi:multiple antibiotic resistance protein
MFVVMVPLAIVALFVSMTSSYSVEERLRTAKTSCLVALGVVEFFVVFGGKIFEFFGISVGSFCIAGGVLIFLLGLEMLRAQNPDECVTEGELNDSKAPAKKKKDIAITPLGVPLIGGPCVITNAIAQQAKASNWLEFIGGGVAVALVIWVLYLLLAMSSRGAKWLTPIILKLSYRLSGLILAALAVEMFINGIKSEDLGLWPKQSQVSQVAAVNRT